MNSAAATSAKTGMRQTGGHRGLAIQPAKANRNMAMPNRQLRKPKNSTALYRNRSDASGHQPIRPCTARCNTAVPPTSAAIVTARNSLLASATGIAHASAVTARSIAR